MYFMKRNPDFKSISAFIRLYSLARKSHYDVLNLRKNCTDKEIKDAFIQMSKEYHPDKNKDVKAQEKFVRIVEAYSVLGKPCSRAQYDNTVTMDPYPSAPYVYKKYNSTGTNPQYSNFYQYAQQKTTTEQTTNQTSAFNKKIPNYVIIMICCGIAFVGAILQGFVIREMYSIHRKQAIERSKSLAEELERVRAAAHSNSNEMQTRILLEKIVTAANPTVATASLGQSLADDKKASQPLVVVTYPNEFGDIETKSNENDNRDKNCTELERKYNGFAQHLDFLDHIFSIEELNWFESMFHCHYRDIDVQLISESDLESGEVTDWSYNDFIRNHIKEFITTDTD